MIKHVIFCLDGVLADSAKAIIPACLQISKKFDLPPVSDEAFYEIIGCASPEFYFRLYPHKSKRLMLEYAREADALTESIVWDTADILFPGVLHALEALVQRRIRLSVISSRDISYANAVLTTAGIQHFFDDILFGDASPEKMIRNLVLGDPSRWTLIGGSLEVLSAAKANGVYAMAAGFGYISRREASLFDRVLKSPSGILSWVR